MDLILLRHADAAPHEDYAEDGLRPLTDKGRKVQRSVAQALKTMGCRPDQVFTSPRVRAYQTAEITADILQVSAPAEWSVLDGGCSTGELVEALAEQPAEGTVMCVGHEPDMSTWAAQLLAPSADFAIAFKKSGVMGLRFEGVPRTGGATLLYFYRPKDLKAVV